MNSPNNAVRAGSLWISLIEDETARILIRIVCKIQQGSIGADEIRPAQRLHYVGYGGSTIHNSTTIKQANYRAALP